MLSFNASLFQHKVYSVWPELLKPFKLSNGKNWAVGFVLLQREFAITARHLSRG